MKLLSIVCCALLVAGCSHRDARTSFDGDAALGYIRTQLAFGPRIPNSQGAGRTGDWILAQMRARADTVAVQRWDHVTAKGDTLHLRNFIARFRPAEGDRVLYVTHWDTRPVSDAADDSAQRQLPVPGANDGASGVALFVALGDALKKTPPTVGVDLLFVDGEDYGPSFEAPWRDVLIGSQYFATHLPSPDYHPLFGVLWDMIGDRDLQIYQEGNSVQQAPEVVARVWQQAAELGYDKVFIARGGQAVTDDHLPLLQHGLRVIDVIDIDYPDHHKPSDLIDKVSAKSLQTVGDVALSLVRS